MLTAIGWSIGSGASAGRLLYAFVLKTPLQDVAYSVFLESAIHPNLENKGILDLGVPSFTQCQIPTSVPFRWQQCDCRRHREASDGISRGG